VLSCERGGKRGRGGGLALLLDGLGAGEKKKGELGRRSSTLTQRESEKKGGEERLFRSGKRGGGYNKGGEIRIRRRGGEKKKEGVSLIRRREGKGVRPSP